jgi:hypothetical protein
MYDRLNQGRWDRCFALIDPKLRDASKVELPAYAEGLEAFRAAYGSVSPWHVRINLHLDAASNKHDPRPFAYVYVVWKDKAHGFHMFRERWVKQGDRWFTRVLGLVPNQQEPPSRDRTA